MTQQRELRVLRDFEQNGRSMAVGQNGMAATSSPLATLAALDMLREGGNAVDAAVTAAAVLCVTEPHMTGLGGDCFAMIARPNGTLAGLNGSGRSAAAATADWLAASQLSAITPDSIHAVTVPGMVDAWSKLLQEEGTITLGEALAPAISLALEGVPTSPRVAQDWQACVPRLAADAGASQHYLRDGRSPAVGELMTYPALAKTLRRIARYGREGFYEGEVSRDMLRLLKQRGSLLTAQDFQATQASWVKPVSTSFAGADILELPPNGQGMTVLIALNIMQNFHLRGTDPLSPERYHLEIEAMKLAWVLRNRHIADPAFVDMPASELLGRDMAQRLASQIDRNRATDIPAVLPSSDTIYLAVVDKNRLCVSLINSIYHEFGVGIVTPKTGITLQNRGAGFTTQPGHPNCLGPSKRPLHTIIPAMARKDGALDMVFGVMGGNYQPMGHTMVALNRYVFGMDVQQSLETPRLLPENGVVRYESSLPKSVVAALAAKGHRMVPAGEPLGGGQIIALDHQHGVLLGGSDPRKDGVALGF